MRHNAKSSCAGSPKGASHGHFIGAVKGEGA